jgi:hypothetical protein
LTAREAWVTLRLVSSRAPGISLGVLGALLVSAAGGCAKPRYVQAPLVTAPWRELATEHFAVDTDLPDGEAGHVARELETYLAALIETTLRGVKVPDEQIPVVAFASGSELHDYLQSIYGGVYVTGLLDRPLIITGGDVTTGAFYDGVARHELAHYVMDLAFHRHLPPWFSEGTASFLETITTDAAGQAILMGRASYGHLEVLRKSGLLPVGRLVGREIESRDKVLVERYYATAWLLVHYLVSSRGDAFEAYQDRLRAGAPADEAWELSFSTDVRQGLDAALADYLAHKRYELSWRRPWRAPAIEIRSRLMSPTELLVTRALVYAAGGVGGDPPPPGWREHASALAAEALRAEPGNQRALRIREVSDAESGGVPGK